MDSPDPETSDRVNDVPVWGRADIARVVAPWSEQERYELLARWTARYLPIWFDAYPRYAERVGLTSAKRELQTTRMGELIERCAALRAKEKVPKVRLNETESAISALTALAPQRLTDGPWGTRIRSAALTARQLLQVAQEGARPDHAAAAVYRWAEIESAFPGDSASLLQTLTAQERQAAGPGFADGHHLVYGRPCLERGLEGEGRAVYAWVAAIMDKIEDDPGPFQVEEHFWTSDSTLARAQRAQSYESFHGKPAPGWLA